MDFTIVEILRLLPADVWYIGLIGAILLLIIVACVPGAGERLINFLQKICYAFRQLHHRGRK